MSRLERKMSTFLDKYPGKLEHLGNGTISGLVFIGYKDGQLPPNVKSKGQYRRIKGYGPGGTPIFGKVIGHYVETLDLNDYKDVGIAESMVPLWGSGKAAVNSFRDGDYLGGGFHLAMTALDGLSLGTITELKASAKSITLSRARWFGKGKEKWAAQQIDSFKGWSMFGLDDGFTDFVMHGSVFRKLSVDDLMKVMDDQAISGNIRLWVCGAAKDLDKLSLLSRARGGISFQATNHKITINSFEFFFKSEMGKRLKSASFNTYKF